MRKLSMAAAGAALVLLAGPALARAQSTAPPAQSTSPLMTFRDALDMAMAQNLELVAVKRGRAVREAELKAAGQRPNPDFSAEITKDTPHGDLAIAFPLDISRTRSRRVDIAKESLAMADVEEKSAMATLRKDLRMAFYGLMAADQQVELADTVLKIVQRTKEAAQARFDEGAAPKLELLQAELGVVRCRADLDLARSSRRSAQATLNALLNRPPGQAIAVSGDMAEIPPLPTLDRATSTAAAANAELLSAEREAAIETKTIDFLKAERWPMPTFTFGTALNSPGEFNVGPHAGISLSLPVFSRNQGEIAGSEAKISQIRARRDAIRRDVEARVFGALERVTSGREQVIAYRDTLLPTATSLAGLSEESYRLGRSSILLLLEAQRALRDVKYDYLQALINLQAAVADLEEILGGPIL